MTDDRLADVARTAWGVARVRARESARDGALFNDPFASRFAGDPVEDDATPDPRRRAIAFQVIIRTRFYDDYLLAATSSGLRQVVLLAAGLDARAFRLPWPNATRLFELDQPDVVAEKNAALADATPTCERTAVGIDLRDDWQSALTDNGFDPDLPTAWLAEGLLIYLGADATATLLDGVTSMSAKHSQVAFEKPNPGVVAPERLEGLWVGSLDANPIEWLAARGWTAQVRGLGEVAASFGRPMSRESTSGFVTASYYGG
jgi:methyltransferase (TIGR00027 family)